MNEGPSMDTDLLIEIVRKAPLIRALSEESLDRREIEQRLNISKSTAHRNTNSLSERGLVEREDGQYHLTEFGHVVAEALVSFEADMDTAIRLAPLIDAVSGIEPACPVDAFADSTVTRSDDGDPFAPLARFVSLVQGTDTLRMLDSYAVAPTYMDEIHGQVLDGLETEVIEQPDVAEDIMEHYPRKCVQLCASEYLTMRISEDLPFGLAIFDSRVGVGIRDPDTGAPQVFIDTDSSEGRDWAEEFFATRWNEAIPLTRFNPMALDEAMAVDGER